jgi:uncharacterized protein (DUF1499 family)
VKSMQGKRPLGMTDGKLAPCPRRPNCVSSEEGSGSARIEPLAFAGAPEAARECLKRAIQGIGGTIEFESDGYIRAVFKTTVLRFVDDMKFGIDPRSRVVHIRSASRIGIGPRSYIHSFIPADKTVVKKLCPFFLLTHPPVRGSRLFRFC